MTARDSALGSAAIGATTVPAQAQPPGSETGRPSAADRLTTELDALEILASTHPESALALAAEAEQAARRLGRVDLQMRARLVRSDALDRSGDVAHGGRLAHEVNQWAAEHGDRALLARSHRQLGWFFNAIGDHSAQLEHALRGMEYLDEQAAGAEPVNHILTLAWALTMSGSYQEARARFQTAGSMAASLGDVDLQIKVFNNLSYSEYLAGETQASMEAGERMVILAANHDVALDLAYVDTLARAQMGLGRYAEAEQTLLRTLAEGPAARGGEECDELAEVLLTVAEAQRLLGATDRARSTLDQCLAHCDERGLTAVRVRSLQERAELLAIEGAYREAYEQHKVFHAEAEALQSAERDAQARTLQAVFETDEARRDGLRFREMSLHDPLTGLYNRRYVDERLDVLLSEAAATGAPLSIGLVDLDFFKLVNDTFSHSVGDEVLKQVAGLLAGAVDQPAFAARLGGEEFLLVMPGYSAPMALTCCEAARLRIRSHGWTALTGDLTVTISVGVVSVTAGRTTSSALLSLADRNLYAAKLAGRDRVIADPA